MKKESRSVWTDRWTKPPKEFTDWWRGHPEAGREATKPFDDEEVKWYGISNVTAWNCQCYREEFHAVRELHGGMAPARSPIPHREPTPAERAEGVKRLREINSMLANAFKA